MKLLLRSLSVLAIISLPVVAQEFDFNSGNDAGLTRYDPLSGFGLGATYSFPGGDTYRIQAPSTAPLTGTVGPARAGAYSGVSYDDFTVSVDLVDWDAGLGQGIGLLGRGNNIGLGTSDGYVFFYFPAFQQVAINRIDNESATVLPSPENPLVALNPALDYRLVFTGQGAALEGRIFALSDLSTPLVTVTATDATYGSGFGGVLVAGTLAAPASATDATFDNLRVVPEPGALALLAAGGGLLLALRRRPRGGAKN